MIKVYLLWPTRLDGMFALYYTWICLSACLFLQGLCGRERHVRRYMNVGGHSSAGIDLLPLLRYLLLRDLCCDGHLEARES